MQKQPNTDVAICPSTAFIHVKDYAIPVPKDAKEFNEVMVPKLAKQYPVILDSYSDLLDCWNHYHPKEKK